MIVITGVNCNHKTATQGATSRYTDLPMWWLDCIRDSTLQTEVTEPYHPAPYIKYEKTWWNIHSRAPIAQCKLTVATHTFSSCKTDRDG